MSPIRWSLGISTSLPGGFRGIAVPGRHMGNALIVLAENAQPSVALGRKTAASMALLDLAITQ